MSGHERKRERVGKGMVWEGRKVEWKTIRRLNTRMFIDYTDASIGRAYHLVMNKRQPKKKLGVQTIFLCL